MSKNSSYTEERFGPQHEVVPKVSVLMITYNHERFIRDAIASVFMQEVDFPIELVIGEDCSTDDTLALINKCCLNAKFCVRLLRYPKNVGMHENFNATLAACRGKYVALLEGDDVWITTDKLQHQVNSLESAPSAAACFAQSRVHYTSDVEMFYGPQGSVVPVGPPPICSFEALLWRTFLIPTATIVFRRECLGALPSWAQTLPWVDGTLILILADRGEFLFEPSPRAIYNYGLGVSRLFDFPSTLNAEIVMGRHLLRSNFRHKRALQLKLAERYDELARLAEQARNVRAARDALRSALKLGGCWSSKACTRARWLARLSFPSVHRALRGFWRT